MGESMGALQHHMDAPCPASCPCIWPGRQGSVRKGWVEFWGTGRRGQQGKVKPDGQLLGAGSLSVLDKSIGLSLLSHDHLGQGQP